VHRGLGIPREVISEWSEYEEQSVRILDFYDKIFKVRSKIAVVAIFLLTFRYYFAYFFTSLLPNDIQTLQKGLLVVPIIVITWRIVTIRQ
jgi:hypothetical protein